MQDKENTDSLLLGEFTVNLTKQIGHGSFASVYAGTYDKGTVAIKIVPTELPIDSSFITVVPECSKYPLPKQKTFVGGKQSILDEIGVFQRLGNNPYIPALKGCFQIQHLVFIVMDFIPGASLWEHIDQDGALSISTSQFVFQQICNALMYCHSKYIVHRDIKPENIMFDKNSKTVKLIDFGLSLATPNTDFCVNFAGTPDYAAPEVLCHKPFNPFIAEVWSLGVTLYTMLCGVLPWNPSHHFELIEKVCYGKVEYCAYLPKYLTDLMEGMMEKNPKQRFTLQQVADIVWTN